MAAEEIRTDVVENVIMPILQRLEKACEDARVPYFYCVSKRFGTGEHEYVRGGLSPSAIGITDSGNEVDQHVAVAAGFPVTFDKEEEIDVTELEGYFGDEGY